jgi:hypothetical protein
LPDGQVAVITELQIGGNTGEVQLTDVANPPVAPVGEILAIFVALDCHVTEFVMSEVTPLLKVPSAINWAVCGIAYSVWVPIPGMIVRFVKVTPVVAAPGLTVRAAEPVMSPETGSVTFAVMVAVQLGAPQLTAVACPGVVAGVVPAEPTVATALSLDVQVAEVVRS